MTTASPSPAPPTPDGVPAVLDVPSKSVHSSSAAQGRYPQNEPAPLARQARVDQPLPPDANAPAAESRPIGYTFYQHREDGMGGFYSGFMYDTATQACKAAHLVAALKYPRVDILPLYVGMPIMCLRVVECVEVVRHLTCEEAPLD